MKYFVTTILICLFISVNVTAQTPAATVPDFTFFKFDNTAFTNKNLATGKKIFFVFFDTECEHCQHAIQYIKQHCKELSKAAVYLISIDSKEKVNSFLNKYGSSLTGNKYITFLQDTKNQFIVKFSPRKYPSLFLYSAQKKLLLYDDDEKNLDKFLTKIKA